MPDCFCAGTRLMTLRGEVPVETVHTGDRVLTLSGNGATLKPVTWIGRIDIDLDRHPNPAAVAPVRVCAGAFEPGMPIRDLLVSPDHALSMEDDSGRRVLIPAFYLVNGVTVLREPAAGQVSYFHVELEEHDILMADGLAAESYPDAGDRALFTRTVVPFAPRDGPRPGAEPATDFTPHGRARQGCAPYLWGNAAIPVHARLLERAYALGHALTEDPDLAVLVDGVRLDPLSDLDGEFLYLLPAGAGEVRLRSRVRVPIETDPASGDTRRLGIALGVALHDGVELDDAAFASGFLPKEGAGEAAGEGAGAGSWRWSTGDAVLALAPSAQESTLELHIHMGWSRYWAPPEQPAESQSAMP